jgi:hypothetical protein
MDDIGCGGWLILIIGVCGLTIAAGFLFHIGWNLLGS